MKTAPHTFLKVLLEGGSERTIRGDEIFVKLENGFFQIELIKDGVHIFSGYKKDLIISYMLYNEEEYKTLKDET